MSYPENPERKVTDGFKPTTVYQGDPGAGKPLAQPGDTVKLLYTNWKGDTRERHLQVRELWFGLPPDVPVGSTKWHPEPQPLLKCLDLEDNAEKDFALSGFRGQGSGWGEALKAAFDSGMRLGRETTTAMLSTPDGKGGMVVQLGDTTLTLTAGQVDTLRELLGGTGGEGGNRR